MNMPLLKVKNYGDVRQFNKIKEEFGEFNEAMYEDMIPEALDLITATFTFLTHTCTKEELKKELEIHRNKLKSRGWETKGTIKIELEDEE